MSENTKPESNQHIVEEIIYEDGSSRTGCRGCLYGIFGAIGCLAIMIALLVGAILVSKSAVEGAFNSLLNIVSGETTTRNITIPIVERLEQLSELKSVRYNFSNIVQSKVEMPDVLAGLYGDSLVLIAVGHIEAGIDLAQLTSEDIIVDNETNTITVNLPAPQLLTCFLDTQLSQIIERSTGVFAQPSVSLDNESRIFALRQFRDLALENGILADAAIEGESTLRQLVTFLEGDDSSVNLVINVAEPDLSAPYPDTCK